MPSRQISTNQFRQSKYRRSYEIASKLAGIKSLSQGVARDGDRAVDRNSEDLVGLLRRQT